MPSVAQLMRRLPMAFAMIIGGIWGMRLIWFAAPMAEGPRSLIASAFMVALASAAASILISHGRRFTLPLAYFCLLTIISWQTTLPPSAHFNWATIPAGMMSMP